MLTLGAEKELRKVGPDEYEIINVVKVLSILLGGRELD
jgi:hypothetical protein